mgnify:CR=1 FL=1
MKPLISDIVSPDAQQYAESHTSAEPPALEALERWTHLHTAHPRMAAGHYQGRLLEMLVSMARPHLAVEVGSFVGYSTACIARGLADNGVLHAIEVEEEYEQRIRLSLQQNGVGERVHLHIGDALQVIPSLPSPIDWAFIDADKGSNRAYYDLLLPKMSHGGYILIDNVLWSGKVLHADVNRDRDTLLLCQFNDYVQSDPRVENVLLPLRDGLMLCRVL